MLGELNRGKSESGYDNKRSTWVQIKQQRSGNPGLPPSETYVVGFGKIDVPVGIVVELLVQRRDGLEAEPVDRCHGETGEVVAAAGVHACELRRVSIMFARHVFPGIGFAVFVVGWVCKVRVAPQDGQDRPPKQPPEIHCTLATAPRPQRSRRTHQFMSIFAEILSSDTGDLTANFCLGGFFKVAGLDPFAACRARYSCSVAELVRGIN